MYMYVCTCMHVHIQRFYTMHMYTMHTNIHYIHSSYWQKCLQLLDWYKDCNTGKAEVCFTSTTQKLKDTTARIQQSSSFWYDYANL